MEPTTQIAFATGVGAAIGALVSNIFVAINGWRERKAQDRRLLREAAFNAAIENFKANIGFAASERLKGFNVTIFPFHTYLFPLLALADEISKGSVSATNIENLIKVFHSINTESTDATTAYSQARKKEGGQ